MASSKQWYQYPRIDNYGSIDPYGGPKQDSNILCPAGTPVTSLFSGTISGINAPDGSVPAWGACLTIRLDNPINSIATHIAYLHLPPLNRNLTVGTRIRAGQVIGTTGTPQGSENASLGFALYNGDDYGFGPTWNEYAANPQLNPVPVLNAAASGTLGVPLASTGVPGSGGSLSDLGNTVTAHIAPNADVTLFLYTLDQLLLLQNPFNTDSLPQDSIAGVTFTDPVAWVSQVSYNVVSDLSALTIRLGFILLGLFVVYKVMSAFIDFGALAQTAESGAATLAKGAMLLV